jgi:hypothetical protein
MFQDLNRWNRSSSKSADALDQVEQLPSTPINQSNHIKSQNIRFHTNNNEGKFYSPTDVPSNPIEIPSPQIKKRALHRNNPEKNYKRHKTLKQILQFGYTHKFKNDVRGVSMSSNLSSSSHCVDTLALTMTTALIPENETSTNFRIDIQKRITLSFDRLRIGSNKKLKFSASSSFYTNHHQSTERSPTPFLPVLPSDYSLMPKLLLLRIFCFLDVNDVISCSLVCKTWNSYALIPF